MKKANTQLRAESLLSEEDNVRSKDIHCPNEAHAKFAELAIL